MTVQQMGFPAEHICIVVGYRKERIIGYFGNRAIYAVQKRLLGTGHAAYIGSRKLPETVKCILTLQGDDSAFYSRKTLEEFVFKHKKSGTVLSLLSVEAASNDAGKVVRHKNGDIELVEKENWNEEHKRINEINTNTFCLNRQWFERSFPEMPRIANLGQYGLPTALNLAREKGLPYQVIKLKKKREWFGINTLEQLEQANRRKRSCRFSDMSRDKTI